MVGGGKGRGPNEGTRMSLPASCCPPRGSGKEIPGERNSIMSLVGPENGAEAWKRASSGLGLQTCCSVYGPITLNIPDLRG